jgi:hypothetical protein
MRSMRPRLGGRGPGRAERLKVHGASGGGGGWASKDRLSRSALQDPRRTVLLPLEDMSDRPQLKRDQVHPICLVGLEPFSRFA